MSRMLLREKRKSEYRRSASSDEESKEEKNIVVYPNNLTLGNIYYFFLAPTLCYELNFPRTCRVRKWFLTRRICEGWLDFISNEYSLDTQVIFLTHIIMALTQQWIIPNLVNSLVPFSQTNLPLATERLIRWPLFDLSNALQPASSQVGDAKPCLMVAERLPHLPLRAQHHRRAAPVRRPRLLPGLVELSQLLQVLAKLELACSSLVSETPVQTSPSCRSISC